MRRGPLSIVIGTSGASPALSRRVRMLLDETLPPGLGFLATALGDARPRLLARHTDFSARAKLMDVFVHDAVARLTPETTFDDVMGWIERELLAAPAAPPLPAPAEES